MILVELDNRDLLDVAPEHFISMCWDLDILINLEY